MIFETIITSVDLAGKPHMTPFGVKYEGKGEDVHIVISPYKPSTTLDNILATKCATMNLTDDVRVFAGAVCKNDYLPALQPSIHGAPRLADCLSHVELELLEVRDDATRPQLVMKKIAEFNHKPFAGFNRAQAAVIELAVLVSRLHMIPKDKVLSEKTYLQIAIDKTAGEREKLAWDWLIEEIENFYVDQVGKNQA
jgi:uncharacterized protein